MKRVSLKYGLMVCLIGVGVWQLGHASYLATKAQLAQVLLNQAWRDMQNGAQAQKPWPWADTYPLIKLSFPELEESMIVLAGASGRNLAFAPAHVSASVKPGERGMSVIGGHRDTHFSLLQKVNVFDEVIVEFPDGKMLRYQVTQATIVDSRTSRIALDAAESMLALVSCYPFDSVAAGGPLRFVVIAKAEAENTLQLPSMML